MLKYLAFALVLGVSPPARAAECSYDRAGLLALDYAAFDADMEGGWRPVAKVKGCEPAAAALIRDWRAEHPDASADQMASLNWHEGQMRAAFGDYAGAIPLFEAWQGHPDAGMRAYAAATVAFLKHDKPGLLAARATLAALPKPDGWDEAAAEFTAKYGRTLTWPENLDVIDGLIACFEKPYADAYGAACRATS